MSHRVPFALSLVVLCGLSAGSPADAAVAVLRVGGDAACDFRTDVHADALQQAILTIPLTVPAGDSYIIRVARNGNYSGMKVSLPLRSVVIEGGYEDCSSDTPGSSNTEINAADGTAGVPALSINGGSVRRHIVLRGLTLKNSDGGGLSVRAATVRLERVSLDSNHATSGGGIYIRGDAPGAELHLSAGSSVTSNTAIEYGGGIYCIRQGLVHLASDTGVIGNIVEGNSGGGLGQGGGLYLNGCTATINTGGAGVIGGLFQNISNNEARRGGGIFVSSSADFPANVTIGSGLSGTGPRPLILNNTAASVGGGIAAAGEHTTVTMNDAIVANNSITSGWGGGVYAYDKARVTIARTKSRCGAEHCSRISGNSAQRGGAIAVLSGAEVTVSGTRIQGNSVTQGGSAYLAASEDTRLHSYNNVIVGNTGPSVAQISPQNVLPSGVARVRFLGDTIAGNPDAEQVVAATVNGQAFFGRTIVNAASTVPVATCETCTTQVSMHCNMFHTATNLSHHDLLTQISTTPGFVDAAGGNYLLRPTAWAIDQCPEQADYLSFDHDLNPRPVDSPLNDIGGPYDMGAYEWNPTLFQDGFED